LSIDAESICQARIEMKRAKPEHIKAGALNQALKRPGKRLGKMPEIKLSALVLTVYKILYMIFVESPIIIKD
jgi:hypothetical protein